MFSNACKYAIRAILFLASEAEEQTKLGSKQIAEKLNVPAPFLAKLMRELASKKIISSSKGPKGGFYMDNENFQKSVWDVILTVDGPDRFNSCFLGLPKCNRENPCIIHHIIEPFRDGLMHEFRDKSIKELIQEIRNGNKNFADFFDSEEPS